VYIHRQVFEDAQEPHRVSFAFGLMGRCLVMLSPPGA
jgi:hypothetical protein